MALLKLSGLPGRMEGAAQMKPPKPKKEKRACKVCGALTFNPEYCSQSCAGKARIGTNHEKGMPHGEFCVCEICRRIKG